VIIAVSIASFTISSCHSKTANEKLVYWSSNNTEEIQFGKEVIQEWNKNHPDNEIVFQPVPEGQSSEEVILAAVVGKTTPSIYGNMWQGDVEQYARAGKLIALDTLPGFNEFIYSRCDSSVVKEVTSIDGHIYQLPWKINPIMMIYNVDIFHEIGYDKPPRTYSEFLKAAEKIKKVDKNGYSVRWIGYVEVLVTWWQRFFDFYPFYLAASNGGHLIEKGNVAFNNKYAIETFAFLKTLFDNKYLPRERLSARQDAFLSSAIATRFTGPWEISHADKFKPEGFHYDFAPLPVPDDFIGEPYTYGDTKNIVIFNTCPNVTTAWNFLKTMLSEKNDYKFLRITSQLPRRKDLISNALFLKYFEEHPKMLPFAKQSKYVKGPDISEILKEVFDMISQQFEACVVYGKITPEQAVNEAAKATQLLLLK